MKFAASLLCLSGITSVASAAALPEAFSSPLNTLQNDIAPALHRDLYKRKGGGGGGGGGGKGGSSGSSSSSSSSSSSGGSSSGARTGGTSSSGSSSARTGSGSNTGGLTSAGSGPPRSFGGGRYYGGGATQPYSSGSRSPSGILPLAIAAPVLFVGAYWALGAYSYPYYHPYSFRNYTRNNGTTNESIPVQCWCPKEQSCGCDDTGDTSFLDSVVGNGTIANQTVAKVTNVNGTDTLVLNGELPNGTTAPGGSDDDDSSTTTSGAFRLDGGLAELSGWWMTITVVGAIVLV